MPDDPDYIPEKLPANRKDEEMEEDVLIEPVDDREEEDIKLIICDTIEDVFENIEQPTAFLLRKVEKKPKISKKEFPWGNNQPGRKGLSSHACTGVTLYCNKCKLNQPKDERKSCSQCKNEILQELKCKSIKYLFTCKGDCSRRIWRNQCCLTEGNKLIIFFPTPHTCKTLDMMSSVDEEVVFKEVTAIEDIVENLHAYNKTKKNKFQVIEAQKLPANINGNKLFLLTKDENEQIDEVVRDGRKYRSIQTDNSSFNKIFDENIKDSVRLYKCRGTYFCQNNLCPFLKRFDVMNQVQIDTKNGENFCVSCGDKMDSESCEGKKYVAVSKDKRTVIVQHEGDHICTARSTYETNIIEELENYFQLNGLSTPFEAVVNHLNKKINFQDAEQAVQDLVKVSLRKWNLKNIKAKAKKKLNPHGPTLQVVMDK